MTRRLVSIRSAIHSRRSARDSVPTASLMRWRGMGETKAEAAAAHDDEADIPMIVAGALR